MFELRTAMIVAVLAALIFGAAGKPMRRPQVPQPDQNFFKPCLHQPGSHSWFLLCIWTSSSTRRPQSSTSISMTTTSTSSTRRPQSSASISMTTTSTSSTRRPQSSASTPMTTTSTPSPSALERAHWCRFSNGTYLPLGYTFMLNNCSMCQCSTSRAIRCSVLQCLPAYCIDNAMPKRPAGQCCAKCSYETATSCAYNGTTYPHGTVMKSVVNKMRCWCQSGNIECRNYIGSLFEGFDIMADTMTIYVIVIVLFVIVLFGLLICCSCTFFFYYYYQQHQNTFEQAYDEYVNSAGWQPMGEAEEEHVVDQTAEDKQIEAENGQFKNENNPVIPPPYSIWESSNTAAQQGSHQ